MAISFQRIKDLLASGREIDYILGRLGIPVFLSRRVTKAVRIMLSLREYCRRRLMVRQLNCTNEENLQNLNRNSATISSCRAFYRGEEVLMACKSIVGKRIDEPRAPRPYDQHVVNLLKVEDIRNNPCLLEFATHKELVALISRYFGTVPILADMQIWWARPNDTIIGAKQFHFDQEDYTTIRLFLYINDVTSESGPLTYFDRNVSEQIKAAVPNWYVRISDKMLDDLSFMDQVNYLTGASGMIALVDPARLCHMGARVKVGDRLILMLHYVCFHSIKEPFSRTIETTLADSSLGSLPNSGLAKTLLHRSTETTRIRLKVDDEVSE